MKSRKEEISLTCNPASAYVSLSPVDSEDCILAGFIPTLPRSIRTSRYSVSDVKIEVFGIDLVQYMQTTSTELPMERWLEEENTLAEMGSLKRVEGL